MSTPAALETVRGWLKALGDHVIAGNPLAAHIAAWVAALSGQPGKVQRLLPVIDAGGDRGPLPDGMRSLRSSAALLRATFGFEGIRVMRESAAIAVELEDDPASPWHALALTVRGFSLYLSGEPGSAEALKRAVLSGVADPAIHLTAMSVAALVAIAEGRPAEGSALADAALRVADDGLGDTPQASLAYLAVAAGWAEQGRLEEARRELLRALQLRRLWLGMSPWATMEIMFRLAAVLHGLGDDAGAATLATEIDDVLISLPDGADAQRTRLELLRHRLGVGPGAEPVGGGQMQGLTNREMTVLRMLRGTMSIAEIAQELELSSNTIKTHTRAIYRKLAVSTRPAAVTRARELGLLLTARARFMHPGPVRAPADILTRRHRLIATAAAPPGRMRRVAVPPGGAGVRNGKPDRAGAGHREPGAPRAVMIQMHLADPLADRRHPPALAHPGTPPRVRPAPWRWRAGPGPRRRRPPCR